MKDREAETIIDRPTTSKPRAADEPLAPPPGRARYEVGAEIARGGMGRVVEAMDTLLGRTVAVKEALVESDEALRRFRREIYITARLEHPSIVPVHDAGTLPDGSMYYVMRKVTGRPLTELIAGAESLEQRLQLLPHVVAAAQALGHAHHRGVIHRDIKPSNILVGELGETVVIDWGLAKVIGEPDDGPEAPVPVDAGASLRTRFGVVFGTPGFMAPEQARGEKVDARSDVYALGATLYYTFTRQPPHARASETEMMVAVASAPAQPIGEVVVGLPRELSTIVDKCLAYDDRARYADAAELAADLQRFVSGQLVASHEYSRRERLARFVRKNKLAVGVATIALLTLAIGGAIAVRGIVSARDRADQQAALATQRQHDAEVSRGKEAERADQLLITQAGVLAAQNPTAAVALLKQLTQPAERWQRLWRQARAIASSARFNGVVRAIPADGYITELRLSPAASRAASIDTDGNIWVYDLGAETRKQLDSNGRNFGMTFLDDDELVMFRDKLARFTNVVTGETRDHTFGFTIRELFGAPGLVLAQDVDYKLHRVDPTTFAETTYAIPEVLDVAIARDNSKVAVCSARGTFVIDVKTNVATKLGDKPGHSAHWDRDSKYLAVAGGHETNLYTFDGKPPTHHAFPKQIVLDLGVTTKGVVYYNLSAGYFRDRGPGTEVLPLTFELTQTTDSGVGIHVLGETALVPRGDAIQVYDAYKSYTLHSPAGPINHLVTREGLRVVAHTTGHLLVWDLAEHYPAGGSIQDASALVMVGRAHALMMRMFEGWAWIDLEQQTGQIIEGLHMPTLQFSIGTHDSVAAIEPNQHQIINVTGGVARLIPESKVVVVAALGDGRVGFATQTGELAIRGDDGKRVSILHHGSPPVDIDSIAGWMVCIYEDGLVVRVALATNAIETYQLAPIGTHVTLTISVASNGDALIGVGRALYRYEERSKLLLLHTTFPEPIKGQTALSQHSVIATQDGGLYTVSYAAPAQIVTMPANMTGWFAYGSELGVFAAHDNTIAMVDGTNGLTWPVPAPRGVATELATPGLSDDAHHLGVIVGGVLHLWDNPMPKDAAETARWLDQLTNASAELGTSTLTFHEMLQPRR